jgi:CRISPR system Cascade subunit CasA
MTEKMKTEYFNLVDEWWLPVTLAEDFPDADQRGPLPRVSLREAFEHGDKIVDLRCYPHERIALMRLLICIAQRALNGPEEEGDWEDCRDRLARQAVAYLEAHKECFNLFGDGSRFLQAHGTGEPGEMSPFRLVLVDKDASVLFDRHIHPGTQLDRPELAVALVTFQSFAAGGKTGGSEPSPAGRKTKAGKVKREPQGCEAALCRDGGALHAFILGANLRETIHWNLVCRSQVAPPMSWNRAAVPVWEYKRGKLADLPESEIKGSYLGRLAPLSRAVWLREDRTSAEIGSGLRFGVFADSKGSKARKSKAGTGIRELTASVQATKRGTGQLELVSASAGGGLPKAAWRELHSIAVLGHSAKRGGPVALEHLRTAQGQEAVLWCAALVGDQAKVGDVVESVFRLPAQFLEDADAASQEDPRKRPGPNTTYRRGIELANDWARKLQAAVHVYHRKLGEDFRRKEKADRGRKVKNEAATRYWTALEQAAEPVLLYDLALHSENYFSHAWDWIERSPWGSEVKKAAADAYNFACPHGAPRQLRAYAAGLVELAPEKRRISRSDDEAAGDDSTEGGEE